ncbi:protein kinase domain-containing protein [Actinocatenispora rupis]|uniref:non-specific serine/threonine protein kinase n=1 Tax=Actinocatenispora rupis TaxID=519421 RepID=A0A8J3NA97_9ACTN|nr:protein kinase [Actinocatenispora rupis]GID12139.1 hypothetical protein Aru02nite_30280 [Actinocatenispora rupis]
MSATVRLTLVEGRLTTREYVFDERGTCILGRAADCRPRLPDDEHHRTVSRHHCLLDVNPPDVRIRDFGSLNGTYVNGRAIGRRAAGVAPDEAEPSPEYDLVDGDLIRLGRTVFRVDVRVDADDGTLEPALCARCGREVGAEIGDRTGEYVCAGCRERPAELAERILAGTKETRRYRLVRELGRGGMGAVFLARHEDTGGELALKLMLPAVAADPMARRRFLREVELTRALRHPHLVPLYDAGTVDGAFWFTSEYCAGGSLDGVLRRRGGRLPEREAVRLAVQALDGLAYAHASGVVHRDLSPHNILLAAGDGPAPVARIGDFGLAKAFDRAGLSGLTRSGTTAGKPWYMPRQQVLEFRDVTPAVDVWALAACLYEALTGRFPRRFVRGVDPWQTVLQVPATPVRRYRPDLRPALADALDHALTERPAIGFGTAGELRAALLAACPPD